MLRNGTDKVEYLQPGEIVKLTISLGHIYHTLEVASCLRVDVTSSNFPRRARNTNSGNLDLAKDSDADIRKACNTVYHGGETASQIMLTVL
jgi:predicted acyl esterase